MKKFILLFILVVMAFALASCGTSEIVGYRIDENGNLIVTYTDTTTENLGKFGSDAINTIDTISISDDGFYMLNGIKTNISAVDVFEVSFVTGYNATVKSQLVKDGNKVERPQLEREGYTFAGWFCNGEEWRFNSDVVKNDMTLTAKWAANEYTVSFVNEKGDAPNPFAVLFDNNVILPTVDAVQGFSFNGWYLNEIKVTDGEWSIADNVTLSANWNRDTYTISFDVDGGIAILPITVESFSKIESLPTPNKADYEFLGWYYNDEMVNLPLDFTEGNKTLKARWKGINEKFDFSDDDSGQGIKIDNYKLEEEVVTIPDTIAGKKVTTISSNAFNNKSNLKIIDFGQYVVNYEFGCIKNCNSLEEIRINGDSVTTLVYMFGNNENIPSSLKTIRFIEESKTFGNGIFTGVIGHLFTVYVDSTITTAPKDAFYECDVIDSIYFSDTITRFESRVVCACSNLTYVKLPAKLQSVGMNNFMNCAIQYIIFPKTLTSSDYGGLCSGGVILVESETRPKGWSSSAFSIYENQLPIYYGFESLHETEDFLYALCKVGSTKQCIIIRRYNKNIEYPEFIDGYPVTFTNNNYTLSK